MLNQYDTMQLAADNDSRGIVLICPTMKHFGAVPRYQGNYYCLEVDRYRSMEEGIRETVRWFSAER